MSCCMHVCLHRGVVGVGVGGGMRVGVGVGGIGCVLDMDEGRVIGSGGGVHGTALPPLTPPKHTYPSVPPTPPTNNS